MRKILIVNNNLMVGGIQKSLVNLLHGIKDKYDVTLLLFAKYGAFLSEVPENIKIIEANKRVSVLGIPFKKLIAHPFLFLDKIISRIVNKLFGKEKALDFLFKKQKRISGYDHVISFSHCSNEKMLAICTPEFVLNMCDCDDKICFIHCDYLHSDTVSNHNNNIYRKFNKIACCSDSVKGVFLNLVPDLVDRTYSVRNFYDYSVIHKAEEDPIEYDPKYINLISVSRLTKEKGIFDAVKAIYNNRLFFLRYYIIGDGPERKRIENFVRKKSANSQIILAGEQMNPYRFMKNADYLLVPSLHEAAPMVFDEANLLGLKVVSTNTTSAKEMLKKDDIIINSLDELAIIKFKKSARQSFVDECAQLLQFAKCLGD